MLGWILSFCVTKGNVDDRKSVPALVGWTSGDKGYLSEKLKTRLEEKGIHLITKVRKNMKAFDKIMLRKRAVIESVNDQLKNASQIERTRHCSPFNFAVN
ncbi:MAG: transposase [Parashewanella sp.]